VKEETTMSKSVEVFGGMRVIKRGKLLGAAGLRQGLGWCVVPKESREKVRCTACNEPAVEGWLVYEDPPAAQQGVNLSTAIAARCAKHSAFREAKKLDPKATQAAAQRQEHKRRQEAHALATRNFNLFVSYLPVPGFMDGKNAMVVEALRYWAQSMGNNEYAKRAAKMRAHVDSWLASLTEAERVLASIGREVTS
jgi:hypothetical protein